MEEITYQEYQNKLAVQQIANAAKSISARFVENNSHDYDELAKELEQELNKFQIEDLAIIVAKALFISKRNKN